MEGSGHGSLPRRTRVWTNIGGKQYQPTTPGAKTQKAPIQKIIRRRRNRTEEATSQRQPACDATFQFANKFKPSEAESIMREIMRQELGEVTAQLPPADFPALSVRLCDGIQRRLKKSLGLSRYKLVCHVAIGQKQGQGVHIKSRGLWDDRRDSYAEVVHCDGRAFVVATVFAIYCE